jgi:hypothetical protein
MTKGVNGILGEPGFPCGAGYNDEIAVVRVAVHDAPVFELLLAGFGVHVAGDPRFVVPFVNCTVPVGPCAELLVDEIVAVSVTDVPLVNVDRLDDTAAVVAALVIVTETVLLVLFW